MIKKYKKIYIEITNICNLNCSFCSIDNRVKESITVDRFKELIKKIDKYTDYVYLHVKGEPLLHPNLKEILDICLEYNKQVNITTNGTLIEKNIDLLNHEAVRQINISLHSENNMDDYLEVINRNVEKLKEKIVILRYWILKDNKLDEKSTKIVENLKEHYKLSPDIVQKLEKEKHVKLRDNLYVDKAIEFVWPSLDNDYYNENGSCRGTRDHIGILVDGTVIPCCLDSEGIINLGNIYKSDLNDIINSAIFMEMKKGFLNNKKICELCKKCNFYELRR
jgi:radical SAM protein with 4Fe4S-binding SPASM domain